MSLYFCVLVCVAKGLESIMKKLRNAKIVTIIFHGFIVIVAGHGLALMCMADVFVPYLFFKGELKIDSSVFSDSTNFIPLAVFSSFFGKIILVSSLFIRRKLWKMWSTILGPLLLLLSFGCVVFQHDDSLYMISFLSGIPFLLYLSRTGYLLYLTKKD